MELSDCTHQWNFLHVRDAAEAALRLGECALESDSLTVNLASTDTRPLRSFVEEIHRLAGGKGVCRYGARRGAEQPVDNCPDVSLLLSLTGWHPRISFSEGITELIETERAAGMGERTHT
jgi:nucleoside-diphosphate-sugar epimerase